MKSYLFSSEKVKTFLLYDIMYVLTFHVNNKIHITMENYLLSKKVFTRKSFIVESKTVKINILFKWPPSFCNLVGTLNIFLMKVVIIKKII